MTRLFHTHGHQEKLGNIKILGNRKRIGLTRIAKLYSITIIIFIIRITE